MPGTIQNRGSSELSWLMKEVLISNNIVEEDCNIIELGARTMDQVRNNKISFPLASHFGYEYENFLNFSMYDQENTDLSLMELDELISIYDKRPISCQPYEFAYNVAYGSESAKLSYPDFLANPCKERNCNRYSGLGARGNPNDHRCATCGFVNFKSRFKKGSNKINICTWFSKSWSPDDKEQECH